MDISRFSASSKASAGHSHRLNILCTKKPIYKRLQVSRDDKIATQRLLPVHPINETHIAPSHTSQEAATEQYTTLQDLCGKPGKVIGNGAFGTVTVYRSKSTSRQQFDVDQEDQLFAVKSFHCHSRNPSSRACRIALHEFFMAKDLHHVNIVRVMGLYKEEITDSYYQIMEFCEAGDLLTLIQSHSGRGLNPDEANCYFKQLMSGVAYLHRQGIAHCDLKPENILLTARGVVKIADFGCSKVTQKLSPSGNGGDDAATNEPISGARGSLPYIAPEEHIEVEFDGQVADVWACGVIYLALRFGSYLWEAACEGDDSYVRYRDDRKTEKGYAPIESFQPSQCKNVIYTLLDPQPQRRLTTDQFLRTEWSLAIDTSCIVR